MTIKGFPHTDLLIKFRPRILMQHQIPLFDANAMLPGQAAAELDAKLQNLGAAQFGAFELGTVVGVIENERMEITVAGVEDIDHAEAVTAAQMDRWAREFDNWAVCDTLCFKLFDRTPHAWRKVNQWSGRKEEFVKRAAFALLASLALHDKHAGDARFLQTLPLIEKALMVSIVSAAVAI